MSPARSAPTHRRWASVALVLIASWWAIGEAAGKTWTTRDGRKIEGLLSGVVDGVVEIDSRGRIVKIPVNELIAADQEYLQAMAQGGAAPSPAADDAGPTPSSPAAAAQPESATPLVSLEPRTWTDIQGRKIEGRFGGVADNTVTIVQDTASLKVRLDRLSPADQIYVRRLISTLDPTQHGRYWTRSTGNQIRATFVQAHGAELWLLTSVTDDRIEVATQQLSAADQEFVCRTLDARSPAPHLKQAAYRTWSNPREGWSMIGRLKDFKNHVAVVEQEHQDYYLKLPDLSASDQDYIRKFFPDRVSSPQAADDSTGRLTEGDWSVGGWNLAAIAMSVFAVSVLTLIAAISLKYVRESFEAND